MTPGHLELPQVRAKTHFQTIPEEKPYGAPSSPGRTQRQKSAKHPREEKVVPNKVHPESTGRWGCGHQLACTVAAPQLRSHADPGRRCTARPRKSLARRGATGGGIPATPGPWRPRGGRSRAGEGRGGRVLACGLGAAAVAGVLRRTRAGPGGALRRDAGCWAGVPCAARARRWWRLAGAGVRDAAQGMGGHDWPRSPLLCIIVDSSYFLFGGLGGKKIYIQGGGRGSGRRTARERLPGGEEGGLRPSPAYWRPRGCQVRQSGPRDEAYCSCTSGCWQRLGWGGSHGPPSSGAGLWPQGPPGPQPGHPFPFPFPSLPNCHCAFFRARGKRDSMCCFIRSPVGFLIPSRGVG